MQRAADIVMLPFWEDAPDTNRQVPLTTTWHSLLSRKCLFGETDWLLRVTLIS